MSQFLISTQANAISLLKPL